MKSVQLFVTCIVDTLYPDVGEAVVDVLEHLGLNVEFPEDQTCCGQPAFNAGMRDEARSIARHIIQVFENTTGPVVVPSGSCAAMIRHQYPELFEADPEWVDRAQALADRVFEFSEFIVDEMNVKDLGASYSGPVTYHPSCHLLREMGVNDQPLQLLENVSQIGEMDKSLEIRELPHADECCGFGGVFSVEHPEISAAMLERKIENITETKAPTVVACDAGCITNLNGWLRRQGSEIKAVHIAEVLQSCQKNKPHKETG